MILQGTSKESRWDEVCGGLLRVGQPCDQQFRLVCEAAGGGPAGDPDHEPQIKTRGQSHGEPVLEEFADNTGPLQVVHRAHALEQGRYVDDLPIHELTEHGRNQVEPKVDIAKEVSPCGLYEGQLRFFF